jgi:hypothetical protein
MGETDPNCAQVLMAIVGERVTPERAVLDRCSSSCSDFCMSSQHPEPLSEYALLEPRARIRTTSRIYTSFAAF